MRKGLLLFILIGLLMSSNLAYADAIKIGYIDVQQILTKSQRGLEMRKTIQARGNELNEKIKKKQEEVRFLKESLEKQASMLSAEARREREREYQRNLRELERLVKDSRDEMTQMERELQVKLLKKIAAIAADLGKKENYTLILDMSFIVYASKEADLTDKVIKAFDTAKE